MIYRGCIKEYINEWVRVYYASGWGEWLREGVTIPVGLT